MKAEVFGLKEFADKMKKLEDNTRGELLLTAVIAGALPISNAAKKKAPYITGTLRRSIHVGGSTQKSAPDFTPNDVGGNYSDVGGQKVTGTTASVLIGTNLVYAAAKEFGRNGKGAKPYLRPAFDEQLENAKATMGKALVILIEKAVK